MQPPAERVLASAFADYQNFHSAWKAASPWSALYPRMTPDLCRKGGRPKTGASKLYRTIESLATEAREVLSTEAVVSASSVERREST